VFVLKEQGMRVESDRQGHHSSEAPACHRCGIPLLEESTYCPYCEQWLDDAAERQAARGNDGHRSPTALFGRINERAVLTAGFVFFAAVAAACLIIAIVIA
jgi:uncharacterized Zn finger protein (UPF0148 family)